MLTKFLRASAGLPKGIQFVGARTATFVGTSSNVIILLTSLTGGLATQPAAGDFVLIYFATGSTVDRNLIVSGYTEVEELYSNSFFDTNLVVAYKFMTGTPDTSITLTGGTGSASDAGTVYVSVWRNVNTTTPLDVTPTTSLLFQSVLANPAEITPITTGAIIVACGAGAHSEGVNTYSSSDLTDFRSDGSNDDNDSTIGGGYHTWTSGSFNPAQFTFSDTNNSQYTSAAVTIALRPA